MTHKRILKLRAEIKARIPQDVVTLEPVAHKYLHKFDLWRTYRSTTTKLKVISNPIWTEWRMNRMAEFYFKHRQLFATLKEESFKRFLKEGKDYPETLFLEAGTRGTKVHTYADKYFKQWLAEDKRPESIVEFCKDEPDHQVWSALFSLEAWITKSGYIPLASELVLWEDFICYDKNCAHDSDACPNFQGIAGTMDNIGVIGDDIVLADWKTSNELREDYELQVGDYYRMFHKFIKWKIDRGIVVKLDKEHASLDNNDVITSLPRRAKQYMVFSEAYDIMAEIRAERKAFKKRSIKI